MRLLDDYLALQAKIFEYFGYTEDWRAIPIDDRRQYYWREDGESVTYADTKKAVRETTGDEYVDEIYKQRFLPKWVYRGPEFTMICVDTHVDGNKFLAIYDNSKEV